MSEIKSIEDINSELEELALEFTSELINHQHEEMLIEKSIRYQLEQNADSSYDADCIEYHKGI